MTDTPGVLCTGRLYCDLLFGELTGMPVIGQEVFAAALTMAAGGGAYITAAYLSALGRKTGLAAVYPAAPFDDVLMAELVSAGLDLTGCMAATPGADPQITVAMIADRDRAFLTRRSGDAVPAGLLSTLGERGFQHLHIGELATLADRPDLIDAARAAGMTISLDCSWDPDVMADAAVVGRIADVDLFLPNRAEASFLSRQVPLGDLAPLVVVKDGPDGAVGFAEGEQRRVAAHPVDVVDTTGAGDAFNAGFIDAWLDDLALGDCLKAGVAAGAVAVARFGGARDLGSLKSLRRARSAAE